MPVLLKAPDHALLCFMQYFVRPYANLPNSRWLVEDAQLAPCRPNLPKSGTLVEFAQLTEASSDMTNIDSRCSEIFIPVDSWKKYLSFDLCHNTNDYLRKLLHAVVSTVPAHFNSRFTDRKCPTQITTNAIYRALAEVSGHQLL